MITPPEAGGYQEEMKFFGMGGRIYEKACRFAQKIITIRLDPKTEKEFERVIKFCYLDVTPWGPASLATVLGLTIFIAIGLLTLAGFLMVWSILFSSFCTLFFLYYIYRYPFLLTRSVRAKASAETMLAVLYMAISLREVPNLELAVKFAGDNLPGPIGCDLRKIMWDVTTRRYLTVEAALEDFMTKWGLENEEFVEAIKTLIVSAHQPPERSRVLINEAIDIIISRTVERMKRYASDLRMPVSAIYALGIMLPVMGLIIFPIVMIFLQEMFNVTAFIVLYDIILPVILYWLMSTFLERKPPTLSQPDIVAAAGKFGQMMIRLGSRQWRIPILPIVLVISGLLISIGVVNFHQYYAMVAPCNEWLGCNFEDVCRPRLGLTKELCRAILTDVMTPTLNSSLIIWAITTSIIVYCALDAYKKVEVRDTIRRLEGEFTTALFQLGQQMQSGYPVEIALDKSRQALRGFEIASFYERILRNIKILAMNFEAAVFDRRHGAIHRYPSRLIRSIMTIIIRAARKGTAHAARAAMTISNYLKGIHVVEEELKEILSEVISSMKFLLMALVPLIAGVTMALSVIVINILAVMSIEMAMIGRGVEVPATATFLLGMWKGAAVTPEVFQFVLGIYVIETTILLSIFVNGIEYGEDPVGERWLIARSLFVAVALYQAISVGVYMMFGGVISRLLVGM